MRHSKYLRYFWTLLFLCVLATGAQAATRFAAPADVGAGNCTSAGNACDLQQALNTAVAGDVIESANGTYTNNYVINTNAGTSGSKILLKSTNMHGAVLNGSGSCSGSSETPSGFDAVRQHWIIEGFDIRNMCVGVRIQADNVEVRHNVISPFRRFGIFADLHTGSNIHHNVIAIGFGSNCCGDWAGIYNSGSNSTIQANWIYALGNRVNPDPSGGEGYGMLTSVVSGTLVKGNVFMDASKGPGVRFFGQLGGGCLENPSPSCARAEFNIVRDNIFAHGAGGPVSFTENSSDNTATNNVFYGNYLYTGPAAKGNDPGRNIFTHNTMILTPRSALGMSLECGDEVGNVCARASVLQDNLFYAASATNNRLFAVTSQSDSIATKGTNLFWQPGSTGGYVSGYTFAGTDLINSQPVFVNESTGDYQLAADSPGKGTASDFTDRGANFNNDLRVDWLRAITQFPTAEKTVTAATSTSFGSGDGVDTSHYYQVWGYVKETSPFTGTETVNVEGVVQNTTLGDTNVIFYNFAPPNRYLYLSTVQTADGTLNVSWTNSNSFSKIFIRRMPTTQESYVLLMAPVGPVGPVAHYPFDHTTGAVADDTVNNLDGQLCNGATCPQQGPSWVAGRIGSHAISFDGADDSVLIPSDSLLNFVGDFTAAFWVKSSQAAQSLKWPQLLAKSGENTTGWDIILHTDTTDARWSGRIWIDGSPTSVYGSTDISNLAWHHLAVTRSGTTLRTYEDGQLANTGAVSGANLTNADGVDVGRSFDSSVCCWLAGQMDDLRLYNVALSASEIALIASEPPNCP